MIVSHIFVNASINDNRFTCPLCSQGINKFCGKQVSPTMQEMNTIYTHAVYWKKCFWPFLSLWLYKRKFQLNSSLTNAVMPLQNCKIGCVYKTPFRKSSHIYCLHPTITPAIDDYLCSFPLCPNFLQIIESLTTGSVTFLIHYVRTWPTSLSNIATFLTAFDIAEACFAIIYIATSHTMHISTHRKYICLKKLYLIRTTISKLLTSSLSKVRSCALQII